MSRYPIPAGQAEQQVEIKKSRFIAIAAHVVSKAQAKAFLAEIKRDYPDARHHCWAYVLGNPHSAASAAMSDDGEPGGTAGKPILNVIQHKKIGDIMVVVVRYFGGIKLGAGGLTRAYSSATEKLLSQIELAEHVPQVNLMVAVDFALEHGLRHWLGQHQGVILDLHYGQRAELSVQLPAADLSLLQDWCCANAALIKEHE